MATISDLRSALTHPRTHFRSLGRLRWNGGEIVRSTLFAEAVVECDGERLRLCMPLASLSLARVERFMPQKRHLLSTSVPELRLLRGEMATERGDAVDILCERVPDALPMADAVASVNDNEEASALIGALDALQARLRAADVSHNNVREQNLLLDAEGEAHLVRWYYATVGTGGDDEAFEELRRKIASAADGLSVGDVADGYDALPRLDGHLSVRPIREGLAAVEDESGWGFVDSENRSVVPSVYLWVNDFREGRAEVETAKGMGLIDKAGRYIIEPRYEVVEYDSRSGRSMARQREEWIEFDYSGQRLVEEETV
ncbi:MAG: WG repeat-containing protein [Rikenellaceae bacterium]|nr:WG repeat-containing protein [Rikenellaceae bacterium]